jgi:hypothetical protein
MVVRRGQWFGKLTIPRAISSKVEGHVNNSLAQGRPEQALRQAQGAPRDD